MIDLSTGSARAPFAERGHDLYETPPEAVRALLSVEDVPMRVWEPAAGRGAIVRVLRTHGIETIATDLVHYPNNAGIQSGVDFLEQPAMLYETAAIVTNPPFNIAPEFVKHALDISPRSYLLLRGMFLEGQRWYRPDEHPKGLGFRDHLARVWMFAPRLPMMHRHGFAGRKNHNSGMAFAWFVFDRSVARFNPPQIRWLNPRDYKLYQLRDPEMAKVLEDVT